MINLEAIAKKLDKILNGIDADIPTGLLSPVTDEYSFMVYSEGLYLSTIADNRSGKNFLPVIIGAYGGENNPIEGLGEQDRNVLVQILFPVKFKEKMYMLEEYLFACLVGRMITIGEQLCVCNTSPAQFSELQDFSFVEFNEWVENTYKMPSDTTETYMAMNITLYISTAKDVGSDGGFVYGNAFTTKLRCYISSSEYIEENSPIFAEATPTGNFSPASQQVLGENYAKGLPQSSAYAKQITLYVKRTIFYATLISKYLSRSYQDTIIAMKDSFDFGASYSSTKESDYKKYYISDIVLPISKGKLLTITLTLSDILELEQPQQPQQ